MRHKKFNKLFESAKTFFSSNDDSQEIEFSEICKFIRDVFGVTQADMGRKLSTTSHVYYQWESGIREPSSKTAFNLCLMYLQALEIKKMSNSLESSELLSLFAKLNVFDELKHIPLSSDNSSLNSNKL